MGDAEEYHNFCKSLIKHDLMPDDILNNEQESEPTWKHINEFIHTHLRTHQMHFSSLDDPTAMENPPQDWHKLSFKFIEFGNRPQNPKKQPLRPIGNQLGMHDLSPKKLLILASKVASPLKNGTKIIFIGTYLLPTSYSCSYN